MEREESFDFFVFLNQRECVRESWIGGVLFFC